jgi:hypothetical protein
MINSSPSTPNSDEAHDDLLATLAAARELDPGMDKALADQYLTRRREEQKKQEQKAPAVVAQESNTPAGWRGSPLPLLMGMVMLTALIVAAVVFHNGSFWWFFWVPLMFSGMWRRASYRGSRGESSDPRRIERARYYQYRWEQRHGYLPPDVSSAPSQGQPELPSPLPANPSVSSETPVVVTPSQPPRANNPFTGGPPPVNPAG